MECVVECCHESHAAVKACKSLLPEALSINLARGACKAVHLLATVQSLCLEACSILPASYKSGTSLR